MLKVKLFILVLFTSSISFAQLNEGQNFCEENSEGSYFPLSLKKKIIVWENTYYIEKNKYPVKEFNGKSYIEFKQSWYEFQTFKLYLREENGVIYQYEECCDTETVRYDPSYKKRYSWESADGKSNYKIVTFKGKLKTPYCKYENLMVLESEVEYGKYRFYYLKGIGYIGATQKGKVISYLTPEIPKMKSKH